MQRGPHDLHIHAIGMPSIPSLPHLATQCDLGDLDRIERLIEVAAEALADRRRVTDTGPVITLVIPRLLSLVEVLQEHRRDAALGQLGAVIRDGGALGVVVLAGTTALRGLPSTMHGSFPSRLLLAHHDPNIAAALGLRPADVPALTGLHGVDPATSLHLVVATATDDCVDAALANWTLQPVDPERAPRPIWTLNDDVSMAEIAHLTALVDDTLRIAVGLNRRGEPAVLELPGGVHALVVGPPSSGKSTMLALIAEQLRPVVPVVAVTRRRSALSAVEGIRHVDAATVDAEFALQLAPNSVVLVDDADLVADDCGRHLAALASLAAGGADAVRVIAAGRPDALRAMTSWVAPLRATRTGVLLMSTPADGDVLRAQLRPHDVRAARPGSGTLINLGSATVIQVGQPSLPSPD
jgi:DNA segregation ATPase FtsK/SpoIIIE, S-DNA-T family